MVQELMLLFERKCLLQASARIEVALRLCTPAAAKIAIVLLSSVFGWQERWHWHPCTQSGAFPLEKADSLADIPKLSMH